eukprot:TRINITY_DN11319_c0_g1_i1.p1 TRINITY_DN11319_c0_g1~~TRINITY_DN11319_c0_g1_i1.p1  ORF type:complete len:512 (+),score=121.71 TRINITY_DN11319_c0_g1_i1:1-1536(+)
MRSARRLLQLQGGKRQSCVRMYASGSTQGTSGRVKYENPLVDRYTSKEMNYNWSPQKKFSTWRRLWIALAQAEKELGLPIEQEALDQMNNYVDNINFAVAEAKEKEVRHDVMSHVHAFGEQCPKAKPIIHLGATSCYVGDNTDLIQMRDGMVLLQKQMLKLLQKMKETALKYKDIPTLGFTHYQPAQLTTVGKRMTLWMQDFLLDYHKLEQTINELPFRGAKGTTGTQASFLELFDGDHSKCRKLDNRVTQLMGFSKTIPVSGQTYTRKLDYYVLSNLSAIAQSANKFATDIRLLMNLKELDEPFESTQIGSSAMAYKRNPMRSERICSLSRYLINIVDNTADTAANQWFERTLDDSANRRLTLPEAFLTCDVILSLCYNVINGIQVWPLTIQKRIEAELPFMATENILMACVKAGGDRQELHEAIRVHSMEAGKKVKQEGKENDLVERIKKDERFGDVRGKIDELMRAENFVGRAREQVVEFVEEEVDPVLERNKNLLESVKGSKDSVQI